MIYLHPKMWKSIDHSHFHLRSRSYLENGEKVVGEPPWATLYLVTIEDDHRKVHRTPRRRECSSVQEGLYPIVEVPPDDYRFIISFKSKSKK